ncbi:MAG: hypothetical protein IGS49_25955 [Chlorogloeopsis fritschii C42_A2020_084]|nr:hypothetical protein [Chlorogloeopsis fritschii]MBF2008796.1 hypothetical protein [Chlorogloeopsis fritschii C42_A2020_084]
MSVAGIEHRRKLTQSLWFIEIGDHPPFKESDRQGEPAPLGAYQSRF